MHGGGPQSANEPCLSINTQPSGFTANAFTVYTISTEACASKTPKKRYLLDPDAIIGHHRIFCRAIMEMKDILEYFAKLCWESISSMVSFATGQLGCKESLKVHLCQSWDTFNLETTNNRQKISNRLLSVPGHRKRGYGSKR